MSYTKVSRGPVVSCLERIGGFLVGIKTHEYCVEHYFTLERYRIGETVTVSNDINRGLKITVEGETEK